MPDSNLTKHALAQAMKDLMRTEPFSKISVGDICQICHMSRKSFYYHFRDKYDLVNWIFDSEFLQTLRPEDYRSGWALLADLCAYFYREQEFYRGALQITGQNSFREYFSQAIAPIMEPLGFNWKISVSLLSGMAAKEIVVSTLGVLYTGNGDEEQALAQRLVQEVNPDGSAVFTPLVGLSLMFFVLLYFPCIATIVAIKNESNSWKWGLFTIAYTCILAWIVSFLIYQIGSLLV